MQASPEPLDFVILCGLSLLCAVAHLCIKKSTLAITRSNFLFLFNPYFIVGVLFMVLDTVAVAYILRRLPLTFVMPLCALVYLFVPLGAVLFFKERVEKKFWFGAVLLLVGIGLLTT